jgi:WD40 repeat protein
MLTGGEDTLLKIWDYSAEVTNAKNFQSFIGHTYGIVKVMFNPVKPNSIITVGAKDGIFFWDFNGDVDVDYRAPFSTLSEQRAPMGNEVNSMAHSGNQKGEVRLQDIRMFGKQ